MGMIGAHNDIPANVSFSSYEDALDFLFKLRTFGTKLGIANIRHLLDVLDRPDSVCRYIHIAGTNGKGSTAAFICSILQKAGLKTGLFTSPHLVDATERIQINATQISRDDFLRLIARVHDAACACASHPDFRYPTFFEFITAVASVYFAEQQCDVVVWETGMGGRLDATNAVTPVASVITSIALDHIQYLGNTIESIAREKCGIIKNAVPVFTMVTDPAILSIIYEYSLTHTAPLTLITDNPGSVVQSGLTIIPYSFTKNEQHSFFISIEPLNVHNVHIGLIGEHQTHNAALASIVSYWYLDTYNNIDSPKYIAEGLNSVVWPGRCQMLWQQPLLVADCAHNPDGMRKLVATLPDIAEGKWTFIIGGLSDKKIDDMVRIIAPLCKQIWYAKPGSYRALPPEEFLSIAEVEVPQVPCKLFESASEVLRYLTYLRKNGDSSNKYIVTGSCYLVGDMLSALHGSTRDLRADDPLHIQP